VKLTGRGDVDAGAPRLLEARVHVPAVHAGDRMCVSLEVRLSMR
jgi:hypothetical protein